MTATISSTPVTESQLGLLVVHRSVPVGNLYTVLVELRLDPTRSAADVRAALTAVLNAQPALRLAFRELPEPAAWLREPFTPREAPLRHVPVDRDFAERTRRELAELAAEGFDLGEAPLLRAVHLRATAGDESVLLISVHHTVFDGYSLQPLVRDLDAALAGDLDVDGVRPARERALLRELDAQVKAGAADSVEEQAKAIGARLRETTATVLYPRPNRPATTDFRGARRELPLSPERSAAVDRAITALGVTPFTFFSAAYSAVLARHGGADQAVFGSPLMARRTIGSHDLCGFFVNTLPLVVDVDWDRSFAEHARTAVDREVDGVRRAVTVPFNRVVRHAAPDRGGNRNPLFSAMLAMQDSTGTPPGSAVRSVREHGTGTAKFDLWLGVTPTPGGWLLELEHDVALLPEPIAAAVADSLLHALDRAAADPSTPLRDLFEDASVEEAHRADGYYGQPPCADLDGWLARVAAGRPDAVAVEEEGRALTYAELAREVAAVATGLRGRGVEPGRVVGLTTTTLVDTVVAMLAVLRLRATFLPLDLALPAERLAHMVGKADCRIAVGGGDPGVPVHPVAELRAAGEAGGEAGDAANDVGEPSEEDGVYVMFTSGSTGNPKGVLMHNRPLVNLTAWQLAALDMDEGTRFLQYAPLGFDVSFQEIVPTLAAGGTVVSREPADRRDVPAVVQRVLDTAVTHVYLPVAALRPFVQAAEGLRFEHLKYVCVSGEQLTVNDVVRDFFARHPGVRLVNLYGPTETHAVTTHRLSAEDSHWPSHVPIGVPLTGVTAQVVDRTGHLAPRGVVGELLLGGDCPARGYVNEPERTAERFVPDPRGTTRYRTGDQVLWDADGVLVFLGRDDHQVKIRGYRVELGEVEVVAQQHPGVRRAVAVARGDGADRHLVLFVQADEPDLEALRRRLTDALPPYMVPLRTFTVAEVPLTGNGKVDRAALLRQADALVDEQRADEAGRTTTDDPLEAGLQALWAELLDHPAPPLDRSLLELGAHSLNALVALSRVEQEHGVRVPILDFFRDPTVAALAELVRERR
ncbi:amino acid adenylation domain-containing protein [Saccharothrix xinjiangensis]|uniref:Amino acid adenylation domain-containing protein n=1 Tax=Saccharothrix xinjiangensis TaxID=204798 RepID=A0ABV9YCL1_9PSEU